MEKVKTMKISKLRISELFGITEIELGDKDYEIIGNNKLGKTCVLEAIRFAWTNKSNKKLILRKGAEKGSVFLETTTDLSIRRIKRLGQTSIDTVKDGKTPIAKKESFLKELFSEIQLNPIAFIAMPEQEQNRIILDLIVFPWDKVWIEKQFGEVCPEIDYDQNILKVLADIQADEGYYFRTRQSINREASHKRAFITELAEGLPEKYKASDWKDKLASELHVKAERIRAKNRKIEIAVAAVNSQTEKMKLFDSDKKAGLAGIETEYTADTSTLGQGYSSLKSEIEKVAIERKGILDKDILMTEEKIKRIQEELLAMEVERDFLDENKETVMKDAFAKYNKATDNLRKQKSEKIEKINLEHKANIAEFKSSIDQNKTIAAGKIKSTSELMGEADYIEQMKAHIPDYNRIIVYEAEVEKLVASSQGYTDKIEKARTLPAEILTKAKLPLDNLSIENGTPLINGMPLSNMSDGEKFDFCIDVAALQKTPLNLILIDGAEKWSKENRERIYAKCKAKGIQFIATRTTADDSLIVVEV